MANLIAALWLHARPMINRPPPATLAAFASISLGTAVTADTVGDVGHPFLAVFGKDLCRLMFVATVAGVAPVVAAEVAGCTGSVVVAIEHKIPVVGESCWFPASGLVTRPAWQVLPAMQFVSRRCVAGLAPRPCAGFEQCMIEADRTRLDQCRWRVITVAGKAIGLGQRLMKCGPRCQLPNCRALGGAHTDVRDNMAGYAALGRCPPQRDMAGEAVVLQRRMRRDQVAWAHHLVRSDEA